MVKERWQPMDEWTIKLVLGAAVTLACALAGRALSQKEHRRAALLSGWLSSIPALRIAMIERLTPLEPALRDTQDALFMHIAGGIAEGMSANEAWRGLYPQLCMQGRMLDCLLPEDLTRLGIFFASLGTSGRSEQQYLLDHTEAELSALHGDAQTRAKERGKLYSNLGLLFGLAVSVCLL